jgi:peptidoglycan/LPS O-acetylase OafA/YrhL
VYLSHIRLFFYPQFRDLAAAGVILDGFYLVTKLGHAAVMIFFVLSGYLVGGSVLKDMVAGRWHWKDYLLKRGTRLYVVLVPALLLTAFWDTTTGHFLASFSAHAGDAPVGTTLITSRVGMPAFICNLFFLQTIVSPPYGSNVALWSLSWEWWYYILFPSCLMAIKSTRRMAYGVLVVLIVAFVGWQIALYYAIWLMGATVGLWPDRWRDRLSIPAFLSGIAGVLMVAALVEAKITSHGANIAVDFGVGVMATVLIGALLKDQRKIVPGVYSRISHRLATLSYTLYVVHVPFLLFLRAAFVRKALDPGVASLPAFLIIFGLGLSYAFVVWWATEARTDRVRETISRAFGVARAQGELRAT